MRALAAATSSLKSTNAKPNEHLFILNIFRKPEGFNLLNIQIAQVGNSNIIFKKIINTLFPFSQRSINKIMFSLKQIVK